MSASRRPRPETTADPTVGRRIPEAIADRDGSSPLEPDPALREVVDPDAPKRLFRDDAAPGRVAFTSLGYRVRVRSDDRVTVPDANE